MADWHLFWRRCDIYFTERNKFTKCLGAHLPFAENYCLRYSCKADISTVEIMIPTYFYLLHENVLWKQVDFACCLAHLSTYLRGAQLCSKSRTAFISLRTSIAVYVVCMERLGKVLLYRPLVDAAQYATHKDARSFVFAFRRSIGYRGAVESTWPLGYVKEPVPSRAAGKLLRLTRRLLYCDDVQLLCSIGGRSRRFTQVYR
jgi:hypothetical protein